MSARSPGSGVRADALTDYSRCDFCGPYAAKFSGRSIRAGLFITTPAVMEILRHGRPMCGHFGSVFMSRWVLFPQPEMAEDALNHLGFIDEADVFHLKDVQDLFSVQ